MVSAGPSSFMGAYAPERSSTVTNEERKKIYQLLAAPFPEEAIERTDGKLTGKSYSTTGIKYQYVANRLNEVLGVGGWRTGKHSKCCSRQITAVTATWASTDSASRPVAWECRGLQAASARGAATPGRHGGALAARAAGQSSGVRSAAV